MELTRLARLAVIGGLGLASLVACEKKDEVVETPKPAEVYKAPEPQYISGVVSGERFQTFPVSAHRYTFALKADSSKKLISCSGDHSAAEMDVLLNTGDSVRLKLRFDTLRGWQKPTDVSFSLCKEDLVEINGRAVKY